MGITTKSKGKSTENWGMGFLVFFPEENPLSSAANADKPATTTTLSSSPSIKRTNSNVNPILTRTQSTLSICALLLFLSLLLFTLSTFEPSIPNPRFTPPRRFLFQKPTNKPADGDDATWVSKYWVNDKLGRHKNGTLFALQGMGKLYLRGTRAMADLLVAHVVEDAAEADFRLFLRLLHRSGLTARADTVFVFPSSAVESKFERLIREENNSFFKLVQTYKESVKRTSRDSVSVGFDVTRFVKNWKRKTGESLWGKRIRASNYNESTDDEGESTRFSYGSVVGFEASELDPENSLAGFLDHVPLSLRRWACYPMLLGRVRRNFKHIMLVDAKNLLLLDDPLSRVRNPSPESVYIATKESSSTSRHKRNSEKASLHSQVNPAILMGGARGIRRFSSAMLTEIVRVAMQHKKKSSVTESGILTELVGNEHILKNINLVTSTESIPDLSSLVGSNSNSNSFNPDYFSIIQRGNTNHDLNSIIMKQICSCELESFVYSDC